MRFFQIDKNRRTLLANKPKNSQIICPVFSSTSTPIFFIRFSGFGSPLFSWESKYKIKILRVVACEQSSVNRNPKYECLRRKSCQNGDKRLKLDLVRPNGRTASAQKKTANIDRFLWYFTKKKCDFLNLTLKSTDSCCKQAKNIPKL
jgi:hypothetical protein